MKRKHIICFSGGESSGITAIEVKRRYPDDEVILLNHDISLEVEDADIKRFKKEIADYLGLPIWYANFNDLPLEELPNQFEICEEKGAFQNPHGKNAICTYWLKTLPFSKYLEQFHPEKDVIIYYGFDATEPDRIERRESILHGMGYESDYPLGLWTTEGIDLYNTNQWNEARLTYNKVHKTKLNTEQFKARFPEAAKVLSLKDYSGVYTRTIQSTREINIEPPQIYNKFKHANCVGCLKGGKQHWYVVYCNRPDVFERGKIAESRLGYTIINGSSLSELEETFKKMKCAGVPDSEHIPSAKFWSIAKRFIKYDEGLFKPCECVL